MKRINRSILALATVGAMCGGMNLARAGTSSPVGLPARQLADEPAKGSHMHAALAHLRYARDEVVASEGAAKAQHDEIITSIDTAIKEIEAGFKAKGDTTVTPPDAPISEQDSEAKYPHLHHAVDRLTEARVELGSAETVFAGHRAKAIDATDNALRLVLEEIHALESK